MKREDFFIFQNQEGKIYAYTEESNQAWEYIDKAIKQGFKYTHEKNGIANIYTIYNK